MAQYLHLTRPPDYTGTLTFSFAPGGELTFEDGETTVPDDVDVATWIDRYAALEVGRSDHSTDAAVSQGDAVGVDETAPAEAVDPPFDPGDYTVDELRDALGEGSDYTLAELEALADAERAGKHRQTALDAITALTDDLGG